MVVKPTVANSATAKLSPVAFIFPPVVIYATRGRQPLAHNWSGKRSAFGEGDDEQLIEPRIDFLDHLLQFAERHVFLLGVLLG
ncbi:hypothetical protein D3C71_1936680 [compost metagenome]